ncbi:hypothetical protein ACGCUQ_07315 [Eubacteriales bacterium KG127]
MKKFLIYAMEGKKMCFLHALMNAKQLKEAGHEVKIILEGQAVTLPAILEEEENPLYLKLKSENIIDGVCLVCSKVLGAYDDNKSFGLNLLDDMNGHAGITPYVEKDYDMLVF